MALQLMDGGDFGAVRALLLPRLSPTDAMAALPDSTIQLPSVGGHAEAIVRQYLGADWPLFADPNSTIPPAYAQGDALSARALCHDACVQFACAQLVSTGFAQQLLPTSERLADESATYGIKWEQMGCDCSDRGHASLALLRRAIPVPGRIFVSPSGGAQGQLATTICVPRHGLHRRGRW